MKEEQKVKIIGKAIKSVALLSFVSVLGFAIYNFATAEQKGRERAAIREKQKGKRKPYILCYAQTSLTSRIIATIIHLKAEKEV